MWCLEQYTLLIDTAENKTVAILEQNYNGGSDEWRQAVRRYYDTVRHSIDSDDVDVSDTSLLHDLLTSIVDLRINETTAALPRGEQSQAQRCLKTVLHRSLPALVTSLHSHDLSEPLRRSTSVARALVRSLTLAARAMDTVSVVQPTEACVSALLRLTYCAHCDGHVTARPCRPFCYTVLRSCLLELTSVDRHYSAFITALHHTAEHTTGQYDLEQTSGLLPTRLYDSLRDTVSALRRQHFAQVVLH